MGKSLTIQDIRDVASDCERTHRWVKTTDDRQGRIIKIGRKWVHVMHGNGECIDYSPNEIKEVW